MTATAVNQRPIRWRGLVVKLSLIAALAMLLFGWLRTELTFWAYETFAITESATDPAEQAHDALVAVLRDRNAAQNPEVSRQLDTYFAARRDDEVLAYALDLNGSIVARSPELRRVDDSELMAARRYRLAVGGAMVGTVVSYPRTVYDDDTLVGFVTSMVYRRDIEMLANENYADARLLNLPKGTNLDVNPGRRARNEEINNQYERIRIGVMIGIAVATALLLGIGVSFFVTRRLRRLAREVEASEAPELPGPFKVKGRDEISLLAGALNTMRTRVTELVDSLRRQDSNRREWIAQVSHDIRTPLTSLTVCLDRAQRELDDGNAKEAESAMQLAKHDLQRVRSFVDDLFEVARLEIDVELDYESIPPLELISDAARSLRPQAEQNGIALAVEGDEHIGEMQGDGHRLMRACENLLSNAIRHAQSRVRIGARPCEEGVCLYVIDNGDGFPGENGEIDLARVSKQVKQADSTGLGLLVARRVAEAHGGSVHAENADGWTRVELRLPRHPAGGA